MSYIDLKKEIIFLFDQIKEEIEALPIPKKDSRQATAGIGRSIVFGLVKHRRKTGLHISAYTMQYPKLYRKLLLFGYVHNFKFTSIMINRNYRCKSHIDNNKPGTQSMIIGFGDYTGGELIYDNIKYNIKDNLLVFDGHKIHNVEPFEGNRTSITFFSK